MPAKEKTSGFIRYGDAGIILLALYMSVMKHEYIEKKNISKAQGRLLMERQKLRYGLGGAYIGVASIFETIRYTLT